MADIIFPEKSKFAVKVRSHSSLLGEFFMTENPVISIGIDTIGNCERFPHADFAIDLRH